MRENTYGFYGNDYAKEGKWIYNPMALVFSDLCFLYCTDASRKMSNICVGYNTSQMLSNAIW